MLVKFLNSDSTVSTAIAGSYFKGEDGTNAIITVFTNKAAYDAYVPAANEIVILNE